MARPAILIWACAAILVGSATVELCSGQKGIGVNWGTMASHPLNPSIVVGMLKDNGITMVKLFDADPWTVSAIAGSNLEVMVAIPNDMLKRMTDYDHAKEWVKKNVTKHLYDGGVDIKYVAVGNEPFLESYNGSFLKTTFPALQNVQKALNAAGHGDKIKATIPLNADVYFSNTNKPSDGNFRKDIKDLMVQIVHFLHENHAPFVVNIYPYLSLYQNKDFPFDFAFFDSGGKPTDDNGVKYTSVFDANYDTLVWTLKKNGVSDLKIIVGEVGWPTDGDKNANVKNAKKFYDGLLKKLAENKGTPLRPGHLEVYLFSLFDEDIKSVAPGPFERHWGIFGFDGKPKFPMDLSGHGSQKNLVGAKGVQYLPAQWCVYNKGGGNMSKLTAEIDYACSNSDCTSLAFGCSCNNLDVSGNISYAFNMYFQMHDQDVQACDFNGLAHIVKQNASRGNCLFPIQIVSGGERVKLGFGASVFAGILLVLFVVM